jgi:PTS system galactitol-specific IIA component
MLNNFLDNRCIELKSTYDSYKDLLINVSKELLKYGYVKESFLENIMEREKQYPTGFELGGKYNIAIPHTDMENVLKPVIYIVVLEDSVIFKSAEDGKTDIEVDIVFVISLNEKDKHIVVLEELMKIFSKNDLIEKIKNSKDKDELIKLLYEEE